MGKKIRCAIVGCGARGRMFGRNFYLFDDVELVAICDCLEYRAVTFRNRILSDKLTTEDKLPKIYSDYKQMLEEEDLDCITIHTNWATHVDIAIEAMKHGVLTGIDCGGAYSIDDCWRLVHCYEETGTPLMYLENCCYGREEMTLLKMIKMGKFGEIVHLRGGYEHDLRWEISYGKLNDHYRFDNYLNRCADFYPAHALGPIMKYIDVNRGNRIVSLTSTASKATGLKTYAKEHNGPDFFNSNANFREGDVITTVLKCSNGETIALTHDTTLPRPYSRGGLVQGTKGIWMEENAGCYFEGDPKEEWSPFATYMDNPEYEHPIWTEHRQNEAGLKAGHGGMDYLVLDAFLECARKGIEPPIDVYDAAILMAVTTCSEQSIALGSAPVEVPDFTNGKWMKREPAPVAKYALDDVYPDRY